MRVLKKLELFFLLVTSLTIYSSSSLTSQNTNSSILVSGSTFTKNNFHFSNKPVIIKAHSNPSTKLKK